MLRLIAIALLLCLVIGPVKAYADHIDNLYRLYEITDDPKEKADIKRKIKNAIEVQEYEKWQGQYRQNLQYQSYQKQLQRQKMLNNLGAAFQRNAAMAQQESLLQQQHEHERQMLQRMQMNQRNNTSCNVYGNSINCYNW